MAVRETICFASGSAINSADAQTARSRALAARRGSTSSQELKDRCEVVATFSDKCFAIAMDPKDGTPGTGWAVADTQREADERAMQQCRATADDRAQFCLIPPGGGPQGLGAGRSRGCDGDAR